MSKRARRGVVLVTVLWSIVLLSTLAMATALTFRGFAGIMGVNRDRLKADGLLTAGLEVAAGMAAGRAKTPIYDVETSIALPTGTVAIRLDDEGGRIDVGRAPADVLAALFGSIGVPDAQALAQQIVEWRKPDTPAPAPPKPGAAPPAKPNVSQQADDDDEDDPNDTDDNDDEPVATNPGNAANANAANANAANANGANAGAPQPPPLGSPSTLSSVAQLLQVPGMRPEWVKAMAPLVTVFGNDTVNPLTAPPAVLALLPGIGRRQLAAFLDARRQPIDPKQLVGMLDAKQAHLAAKPQQAISVHLRAALADGYAVEANAVIVCLKGDREPYRVLAWTPTPPPLRP
jgi:general secretion pathway protein K